MPRAIPIAWHASVHRAATRGVRRAQRDTATVETGWEDVAACVREMGMTGLQHSALSGELGYTIVVRPFLGIGQTHGLASVHVVAITAGGRCPSPVPPFSRLTAPMGRNGAGARERRGEE